MCARRCVLGHFDFTPLFANVVVVIDFFFALFLHYLRAFNTLSLDH